LQHYLAACLGRKAPAGDAAKIIGDRPYPVFSKPCAPFANDSGRERVVAERLDCDKDSEKVAFVHSRRGRHVGYPQRELEFRRDLLLTQATGRCRR